MHPPAGSDAQVHRAGIAHGDLPGQGLLGGLGTHGAEGLRERIPVRWRGAFPACLRAGNAPAGADYSSTISALVAMTYGWPS